jgi:hypothetical protein
MMSLATAKLNQIQNDEENGDGIFNKDDCFCCMAICATMPKRPLGLDTAWGKIAQSNLRLIAHQHN